LTQINQNDLENRIQQFVALANFEMTMQVG
jgi:hypothetical protein